MGQMNSLASSEVRGRKQSRERELPHFVETEIIPRLMLLHAAPPFCPVLGDEELAAFLASLRSTNYSAAQTQVAQLLASGIPAENVVAQLIVPSLAGLDELLTSENWTVGDIFTALVRLRQVTIELEGAAERRDRCDSVPVCADDIPKRQK